MLDNLNWFQSYRYLKYRSTCANALSHWQVFRIVIIGGVRFSIPRIS